MNIAIIVYAYYSRDARVRRYAESLARQGYKVDCICLKEQYLPQEKNISLIQFPLPRQRLNKWWYFVEYFLFFIYSAFIISRNHLRKNYRIIHVNNMPDILVFSTLLPKIAGAKILLDIHDPMPELYISKYKVNNKNIFVRCLLFFEKISLHFANHIITANENFEKIFLKRNSINENKISVILNCPDPKIFKPHLNYGKKNIFNLFYMGTVENRSGLDIVIDSLPKIIKKIPDFKFIIVPKLENEGKYFKSLLNQIRSSNLLSYIEIEAPKSLEQIAQKLSKISVGLVLVKKDLYTENIFPVKLLEFIQMNIPIIATKTKLLNQYFDNNQLYFLEKYSSTEFTKAVLNLYKNKQLGKKLAKNAKNYLRKNNWEQEEKKYLGLIYRLIK